MAERLIAHAERGENVLVIAHGFFNTMVRMALQRRGWKAGREPGLEILVLFPPGTDLTRHFFRHGPTCSGHP